MCAFHVGYAPIARLSIPESNPPTHMGFISTYSVITGGVFLDRFKKKDQKEGGVLVFYCCLRNQHKYNNLEQHNVLSCNFCGSGVWAWVGKRSCQVEIKVLARAVVSSGARPHLFRLLAKCSSLPPRFHVGCWSGAPPSSQKPSQSSPGGPTGFKPAMENFPQCFQSLTSLNPDIKGSSD